MKDVDVAFPHDGGCRCCREAGRCNVCGREARGVSMAYGGPCTNGRCYACHGRVCEPGGITYPGHGFGSREAATRQAEAVRVNVAVDRALLGGP